MSAARSLLSRRHALELAASSAAFGLASCIPSGPVKRPLEMTPSDRGDGWELSTPEDVGLDPAFVRRAFERVFSEDEFLDTVSLLVICQGKLVAEGYTRDPADAQRKEFVQSVTKSITSMAFGISWPDPPFDDLDAPVSRWLEVKDPAKASLTLRHLLTMRSGIDIDQNSFNIETAMRRRRHVTDWVLSSPLFAPPGAEYRYADCTPQVLAAVVRAATGETVETIARSRIFEPLGIVDVDWEHNADGDPFGPFGVRLRPRDFAKIGELTLRKGQWGDQTLVPQAWLDLATQTQTETNHSATHGIDYGFYFWVLRELGGFSTWGHGGNYTVVVPSHELVVVLTGMPNAGDDIAPELWDAADLAKTILAG